MTALQSMKNTLIYRIMATRDEKLLQAINTIFDSTREDEIISLTSEQIEMLQMSESDIENSRLFSEDDLDEMDR